MYAAINNKNANVYVCTLMDLTCFHTGFGMMSMYCAIILTSSSPTNKHSVCHFQLSFCLFFASMLFHKFIVSFFFSCVYVCMYVCVCVYVCLMCIVHCSIASVYKRSGECDFLVFVIRITTIFNSTMKRCTFPSQLLALSCFVYKLPNEYVRSCRSSYSSSVWSVRVIRTY